jgi:hypothetical protein
MKSGSSAGPKDVTPDTVAGAILSILMLDRENRALVQAMFRGVKH